MALEALVYRFNQQTETREEELANRLETESTVRPIGASDIEDFRTNWVTILEEFRDQITTLETTVET